MSEKDKKYKEILLYIRQKTPLLQMTERGLRPEQIKEAITELLKPYFENHDVLSKFAVDGLVPDAIVLSKLVDTPWNIDMLEHCIETHHRAKAVSSLASLEACANWIPSILSGLSRYWSLMYLEHDKNHLEIEEFAQECLQIIGTTIEGCTKPYLKELLHQIHISQSEKIKVENIENLKLGQIIHELISKTDYPELFSPPNWNISLNQWRNIAHHLSMKIEGNYIICKYGTFPRISEIRLSKKELMDVTDKIKTIFDIIKLSHTLYFIDNIHIIYSHGFFPQYFTMRSEMDVLNFALGLASQGFELIDITWKTDEAIAIIRDVLDSDPDSRRAYVTQLPCVLWKHTEASRSTIEYQDKDGSPNLRVSISQLVCESYANGDIELDEVANLVEIIDLKTGSEIHPIQNLQ